MNHGPYVSLSALAAKAAGRFSDIEANAGLVREEFITLAIAANDDAALTDDIPTPSALLSEWFAKSLDRQAKSRQATIKKSLANVQGVLDLGNDYDSVVLVCGAKTLGATSGRITTLGLLTANDLDLMDRESAANMAKIIAAHETQHAGVLRSIPKLRQFRDYKTYCEQVKIA